MSRKSKTLETHLEAGGTGKPKGLVVMKWRSGLLSEFSLDISVVGLVCLLWGVGGFFFCLFVFFFMFFWFVCLFYFSLLYFLMQGLM